jgi:hypothetical protein
MRHNRVFLLFLFAVLTSGCATVGSDSTEQVVLVKTKPKGADIFYKGQKVGVSPMLLEIDSGKKPEFEVQGYGLSNREKIQLKTHYRWRKSFLNNFVWAIVYAPVGWLVDYLSGGAWEIEDPELIELAGAAERIKPKAQQTLAIAPPQFRSFELSTQLGIALEKDLRNNTKYQVFDFRYGEPHFYSYERTQGLPDDRKLREQLYHKLGNDLILTSKAEAVSENTIQVEGKIEDVYTGEVVSRFQRNYETKNFGVAQQVYLAKTVGDYFYFIPNTVYINFGRPTQQITLDNEEYNGKLTQSDSFIDQVGQVVERVSLSRVIPIQNTRVSHWDISFLPDATLSRDTVQYEDFEPIADQSYERTVLSAGYGVRFAYVAKWGMPYFDLIPHYGWTQISSTGGDFDVTVTDDFITLSAELGYIYHLNRNWVAKAFSRSTGENAEIWQRVINETNDTDFRIDGNQKIFAGLSLGYRFDFGDQPANFQPKR